jgi:hypothetical protein
VHRQGNRDQSASRNSGECSTRDRVSYDLVCRDCFWRTTETVGLAVALGRARPWSCRQAAENVPRFSAWDLPVAFPAGFFAISYIEHRFISLSCSPITLPGCHH